jgi:hypothetical protein
LSGFRDKINKLLLLGITWLSFQGGICSISGGTFGPSGEALVPKTHPPKGAKKEVAENPSYKVKKEEGV